MGADLPNDPALWGRIIDVSPDALLVYGLTRDRRGRVAAFRPRLSNVAAQSLLADPRTAELRTMLPECATEDLFAEYAAVATSGAAWSFDKVVRDADGSVQLALEVEVRLVRDETVMLRISDVTRRFRMADTFKLEAERLRLLARRSRDVLLLVQPGGEIAWASDSVDQVLGRDAEDLVGKSVIGLVHEEHQAALLDKDRAFRRTGILRLRGAGEPERWLELAVEDRETHRLVVMRDVTSVRQLENTVAELTGSAGLPGVVVRRTFIEQLVKEVARRRRYGRSVSVVALAMDGRTILRNAGQLDEAHRTLAASALSVLRVADVLGAWSDDVFVMLLPETPVQGALRACQRLNEELAQYPLPMKHTHTLSVSAAATTVDFDDDARTVLKRALRGLSTLRKNGPGSVGLAEYKAAA